MRLCLNQCSQYRIDRNRILSPRNNLISDCVKTILHFSISHVSFFISTEYCLHFHQRRQFGHFTSPKVTKYFLFHTTLFRIIQAWTTWSTKTEIEFPFSMQRLKIWPQRGVHCLRLYRLNCLYLIGWMNWENISLIWTRKLISKKFTILWALYFVFRLRFQFSTFTFLSLLFWLNV
jgi:hypothetical protein